MKDFFISYTAADRSWAEWIAWTLEKAGYSVVIQAWDFRPGSNFVLEMERASAGSTRILAVLSEDYLNAAFTQSEWAAAFASDPQGNQRKVIPVRVKPCEPKGLLSQLVYVDLVGLSEPEARAALIESLAARAKPSSQPAFPADGSHASATQPTPPRHLENIALFFSYAHADEQLRDELETHLSLLRRQGIISTWHDRRITPGSDWSNTIDRHIAAAQVILLLVSADFLASDYCYGTEVRFAMERHERGDARVIPIILRASDWRGAPFGKLQALPRDARPVTSWPNRDEALSSVAEGIRLACSDLMGALIAGPLEDPRGLPSTPTRTYRLVDVFKYPGVPEVTFVEPEDFYLLKHSIRQPGLGVVIEGPSGIGKTTALKQAIEQLRAADELGPCEVLSARRVEDIGRIRTIEQWHSDVVVLDDFHRLEEKIRTHVSDYLKELADREAPAKLIVVGIPGTGKGLIELSFDLATRVRVFTLGRASNDLVLSMINKGERALNLQLDRKSDVVIAAAGSLNIAQILCSSIVSRAGIDKTQQTAKLVRCELEIAIDAVMDQLRLKFADLVRSFAAVDGPTDTTCINLLQELGHAENGFLSLRRLQDRRRELAAGIERFITNDYMATLRSRVPSYDRFIYYDSNSQALVIDDPQLAFFLGRTSSHLLAVEAGKI